MSPTAIESGRTRVGLGLVGTCDEPGRAFALTQFIGEASGFAASRFASFPGPLLYFGGFAILLPGSLVSHYGEERLLWRVFGPLQSTVVFMALEIGVNLLVWLAAARVYRSLTRRTA